MVVENQKLSPAALSAGLKQKSQTFARNFQNVCAAAKEQGFSGIAKLLWQDLFGGRSLSQWLYLIALSSLPFVLEFTVVKSSMTGWDSLLLGQASSASS